MKALVTQTGSPFAVQLPLRARKGSRAGAREERPPHGLGVSVAPLLGMAVWPHQAQLRVSSGPSNLTSRNLFHIRVRLLTT